MTRGLLPRIATLRSAFDYEKLPTTTPSSPSSSSSSRTGYLSRPISRSPSPSRLRSRLTLLRPSRSTPLILGFFLTLLLFASYLASHPIDTHIPRIGIDIDRATSSLQAGYDGALQAAKEIYIDQKGKFIDNRPYIQNPWAEASCAEWDPAGAEEHDPPMCERARLYRQVKRVLVREERGKNDQ